MYWEQITDTPIATEIGQCVHTVDCPNLNGWGFIDDEAVYQSYLPLIRSMQ